MPEIEDLPVLIETWDHDIASEEWINLQDELQEHLDVHGILKCVGLVKMELCNDCDIYFGDAGRGVSLALKLARFDSEFRKGLESDDDDEFDPRSFTD